MESLADRAGVDLRPFVATLEGGKLQFRKGKGVGLWGEEGGTIASSSISTGLPNRADEKGDSLS